MFVLFVSFEKTWYMCNDGTEPWPLESYIQCVEGADFGCSGIPIPLLIPGEKFKFSVVLRSPSRPGLYHSKWRLCTRSGACFGGEYINLTVPLSCFSVFFREHVVVCLCA